MRIGTPDEHLEAPATESPRYRLLREFLPEMAVGLRVRVARAGLLVTAFAIGMIAGSPAMVIHTLRLPRALTLQLALVVFVLSHVLIARSQDRPHERWTPDRSS